jgi:aminopeptidase N
MMADSRPSAVYLSDYKPAPYNITDVELDISIDATRTRVASRLSIGPNPSASGAYGPLLLNGEELELETVSLNGRQLQPGDYDYSGNILRIPGPPQEAFTLSIVNYCNPSANTALSGLYRSSGIYCTQCEAEGFRRITFAYDRPDVMSTYSVRIEADRIECPVLLSNGNRLSSGEIPSTSRHYSIWRDPHPKPTYLFALVAGNLACVKDEFLTRSGRQVELGIYVEHGKEDRCVFAMQSLKSSMEWDERRFGCEYDLDVFNIVAISDFNMGAMENKGLNIFNDKYILALPTTATDQDYINIEGIIAHEYFHNWTGNRITCRDWFQLCLKEGLTVFRDQEFTSDMRSRAVARIADVQTLRSRQFPEDAGPLAHPPRPSSYIEINNFYTPTVYEKGAEICRMLLTLLGEATFRKGMDVYLQRHDGEAATVEQFVACFADASGRDLDQFFRWYEQAGTPVVKANAEHDPASGTLTLILTQSTAPTPGQPEKKPQHIPLRIGILDGSGQDMPLRLQGAGALNEPLIELREESQAFTFTGIDERPVLSLNRSYSAPIVLETEQSSQDRLFLMRHDNDRFNRWEAGQTEATRLLVATVKAIEQGSKPPDVGPFAAALQSALKDSGLEQAFKAQMLALPTEAMICTTIAADIDTDCVHVARRQAQAEIGRQLLHQLHRIWNSTNDMSDYAPSAMDCGRRALRYAALTYLTAADTRLGKILIAEELESARHMTAEIGALTAALQLAEPEAVAALALFYDRHRDDHLLVDKWFSLMASIPGPAAPARINSLLRHPEFKLTTPNRVYAVVGSFTSSNISGFNAADGSGYQVVADTIIRLDPLNPQVAARIAQAFRSWKIMNKRRQDAAKTQLERIVAQPNLSSDCHEIVSRILG